MRDEEQDVIPAQEHALHGEEVARDDARRLGAQELAPIRTRPPRGRVESRAGEQPTDRRGRYPQAELGELAADPPMAQRGFSRASRSTTARTWRAPAGARDGRATAATSGARAPDATATESAESPGARRARRLAGGRPPPQAGHDQRPDASAAHLTLQHLELVASNQQLKVLDVQATTTPNERSQKP
jgi:hypothetical protein